MRSLWIVFWIVVALLLAATSVVGYIVYHTVPPTNSTAFTECLKALGLCFGGAGVILSTYFTAVNSFQQRAADVVQNTFDLLTKWDDPHLFNARKYTRKTKDKAEDTSNNKLLEDIEANEDLKNSVILVLNYFEHIRFSIENKRIDTQQFKRSLGATVINIANRFMPYVKKLGTETEADLRSLIALLE